MIMTRRKISFDHIPEEFRLMLHDDKISGPEETNFFSDIVSIARVLEQRTLVSHLFRIAWPLLLVGFIWVIVFLIHENAPWWIYIFLFLIGIFLFEVIAFLIDGKNFYLIINAESGNRKMLICKRAGTKYNSRKIRLYVDALAEELQHRLQRKE